MIVSRHLLILHEGHKQQGKISERQITQFENYCESSQGKQKTVRAWNWRVGLTLTPVSDLSDESQGG